VFDAFCVWYLRVQAAAFLVGAIAATAYLIVLLGLRYANVLPLAGGKTMWAKLVSAVFIASALILGAAYSVVHFVLSYF
jgi:hypothetical protein